MTYVLGKNPPLRYYKDVAVKAIDYVNLAKLPNPPNTLPSIGKGITFGMFGNDRFSDCTHAALSHMEQAHSARAGKAERPTDGDVLYDYHQTGLEQGLTDNDGRYMENVLSYMKRVGARQADMSFEKIIGYVAVDWRDYELTRAVTWLFGGTYNGFALPADAEAQIGATWKLTEGPGAVPGSWGGHAIFKTVPGTAITWARRQAMTWSWHQRYCDESYAVLTDDWTQNTKAPNGFSRDELIRDLASL